MQCTICLREGCQIGWHLEASKAKSNAKTGKTEKGQGQEQAGVVEQVEVSPKSAEDVSVLVGTGTGDYGIKGKQRLPRPSDRKTPVGNDGSERKQRWDRKSYNAYQREYMRKYRAKRNPE